MKSLRDYIIESGEEAAQNQDQAQSFKFDFSKFENAKETVESIITQAEEFITDSSETSFTISCKNSDAPKLAGALEIIKSFINTNGKSTTRASNEQYAQFCQSQERMLQNLEDFLKPVEHPEPAKDEDNEENEDGNDNGEKDKDEK